MGKVYIFLADGFEEIEGLTVVDLLRRVEIETVMVSITGNIYVQGSHQITVKADAIFEDIDYGDAEMLVLPGGLPGTNHLMEHMGLDALLRDFYARDLRLAAICAAPSVLGSKGLLKGRNATCFPGHEDKMLEANLLNRAVVMDGKFITSRGMGTSIEFGLSIIKTLKGEEAAIALAGKIQYQGPSVSYL